MFLVWVQAEALTGKGALMTDTKGVYQTTFQHNAFPQNINKYKVFEWYALKTSNYF